MIRFEPGVMHVMRCRDGGYARVVRCSDELAKSCGFALYGERVQSVQSEDGGIPEFWTAEGFWRAGGEPHPFDLVGSIHTVGKGGGR